MNDHNLLYFYGWWQLSVCLFAFIALLSIWFHIGKKLQDRGQVFLAFSILCWSVSGLITILSLQSLDTSQAQMIFDGSLSILSLLNSLFILLALPWFKYIPELIKPLIQSKFWIWIIGVPFVFSLLPTISKMYLAESPSLVSELDVYYSTFTLLFLGAVLWESFAKRHLKSLSYLSLICIMITFFAQVLKLNGNTQNLILFSAIFKSCLIMIFFALALSWVKEIAENVIPDFKLISLDLSKVNDSDGKWKHEIKLTGLPGEPRIFYVSKSNYELLELFVSKRISNDDWLEIKPKAGPINRSYDINDHNEIKRLLHSILDGLFGKGNWNKENHVNPLRHTLFELSPKRERKIRLRLLPERLSIKS